MLIALWIVLALVLLFYLAMPLLIKKTQTLPAKLSHSDELAPEIQDALGEPVLQWRVQLQQQNFVRGVSAMLVNGQVNSYYSVYKRADDNAVVMLVSLLNAGTGEVLHYVEFIQVYTDGSSVLLNNSSIATAYPPTPTKIMLRLPELQGVEELWQLFKQLRQQLAAGRTEQHWQLTDAQALVARALATEVQELAARGYCEAGAGEPVAKLTLKGAYYMTWKQLPPFKQIGLRAEQRRSQRLLAQLDSLRM